MNKRRNNQPKKKTNKTPDPLNLFWAHSLEQNHPEVEKTRKFLKRLPGSKKHTRVISIDPGSVNLGIRIEERYTSGWIIPIYYHKWSLRKKGSGSKHDVDFTRRNLAMKLEEIDEMVQDSHIVLIERQLKKNYECTRLMESLITYFVIKLKDNPNYPLIYTIDPKLKGRLLGARPGMKKADLKKWAAVKAKQLLKMRQDDWSFHILDQASKDDDYGDIVCQIEAYFIHEDTGLETRKMKKSDNLTHPDNSKNLRINKKTQKIKIRVKRVNHERSY